ncbi:TetR/AcrR family transcriptional regulator [Nakamurella alba]|uniref:TetR/AcrR family transcriptional regulator n=1 Tax=Nakamurella alba TaxID=2665158 RepID=UPI002AC3463E|nr:TetR/AcrR family transcriptional regulator C-terminal domain-containing protein [Nakamurella alba]
MADRSGAGDPAQTLRLLWRAGAEGARGPRRKLGVDDVVRAGVAVADEQGTPGLTIRKVAERLGTGAMTVYTYVPGRAELLDLMIDLIELEMPRPPLGQRRGVDRLRAVADSNREMLRAHPWLAMVHPGRPTLGPGATAKYDHELAAFDGLGIDDVVCDDVLQQVLAFVRSAVRLEVATSAAEAESGASDEQWWAAAGPLLAEVLDPDAYPRAVRIGAAAGAARGSALAPDHFWTFGLDTLLAGLTAQVPELGA